MKDPLRSWVILNEVVVDLSESRLLALLEREGRRDPPRVAYVNRLYCRYSAMRRSRERKELGLPVTRVL